MEKDNGCYLYLKCKYNPSSQKESCKFYENSEVSMIDINNKKYVYCKYYSAIFSRDEIRCLNKEANKQALLNILNGDNNDTN